MGKKVVDLGQERVGKLLFSLALPAIVAQLVNILYNIVDRMYIGRIENGEIAMAGVGVAMPLIMIIAAFSGLVGSGGAPLAAIQMGRGKNNRAENIMSNSFSTLIIISIVVTTVLSIFKEPILWAFGASEATIGYAKSYLEVYLIGTIFVQIALGMNPFINTQGFAKIGMMTITIGAVINIVLDPIFIFTFNMGVRGAALATILSQAVSAIWVLKFLLGKRSVLKIRKKYLVPKLKVILPILSLGISPFIMQSTEALVLISLNKQLLRYGGDLAVGAMTIMNSIMQIVFLPLIGISQGAQPIVSFNYGAEKLDRVKSTFKILIVSCLSYTFIIWISIMLFPEVFVMLFNNGKELIRMTAWSMRIYFAGIFLIGAQIACQQTFLALGQAKISLVLALLRKVILLIPLIFILPTFIENGLFATLLAEPVADVIASLTTITCFTIFYKKALSKVNKQQGRI